MAFIEIKNQKDFALQFIENSIIDKQVTLEDYEDFQNAEIRRKKDWEEWNDFLIKYRSKASRINLEELGESFENLNQTHIINNKVDELDIKIMKSNLERRTKYIRRLRYILFLVSDIAYANIDGNNYSVKEIYNILKRDLIKDTEKELKDQIFIAEEKLKINEMSLRKDNKYFLTPNKKDKLLKQIEEYQRMLQQFERGGFQERDGLPNILGLSSENPINTYKAIFDTNPIVFEDEESYNTKLSNKNL